MQDIKPSKTPRCTWPVPRSKMLALTGSPLAIALPLTSDAEPFAQRRKIVVATKWTRDKEKGIKKEPDSHVQSDVAASETGKEIVPFVNKVGVLASFCEDGNRLINSSLKGPIIRLILSKYGDITSECMLKSEDAKFKILELVADVVDRLCNNTIESLTEDEMKMIVAQTTDAAGVGFDVTWLQQRVDEVVAAFEYKSSQAKLNALGREINSARKSLKNMKKRHEVLSQKISAMDARMIINGLKHASLGEGLLF